MPTPTQPKSNLPNMKVCENCGEEFSGTYKRCPFCDERSNKVTRPNGRQTGKARNPMQLAGLVGSIVLVVAATFIVFTKVSPLIFQRVPPSDEIVGQLPDGSDSDGENQEGEVPDNGTEETPETPNSALTLSRTEITLTANEVYTLTATVASDASSKYVTWTSSDPSILPVNEEGTITNKNKTGEMKTVTITARTDEASAECIVSCRSEGSSSTDTTPGTITPTTPSTSVSTGEKKEAVVVNADSGLNIRSGPGSSYEKVASAANGATVTVLEDAGNGWYKIDYGKGQVGYVSSSFIRIK